jgi:hypothetical protein
MQEFKATEISGSLGAEHDLTVTFLHQCTQEEAKDLMHRVVRIRFLDTSLPMLITGWEQRWPAPSAFIFTAQSRYNEEWVRK